MNAPQLNELSVHLRSSSPTRPSCGRATTACNDGARSKQQSRRLGYKQDQTSSRFQLQPKIVRRVQATRGFHSLSFASTVHSSLHLGGDCLLIIAVISARQWSTPSMARKRVCFAFAAEWMPFSHLWVSESSNANQLQTP